MHRPRILLPFAVALALVAACQRQAPTPAAAPEKVENAALGLAITALPQGVTVAKNSGAELELAATGASGGGQIRITVDDSSEPFNLVDESKRAGAAFAERTDGKFAGGTELVTPTGPAYTVRGTWSENGKAMEERSIFLLHPDGGGRLLTISERYPAGDAQGSRDRMSQMLDLLGEIEALPAKSG